MNFLAPYKFIPVGNLGLHFDPEHLADLRGSGLTDETIKAAGIYSLAPRFICSSNDEAPLHGGPFFSGGVPKEVRSALCFPYRGGEFARIKLFPPGPYPSRPKLGKIKYSQPPGTSARLYVPFPVNDGPLDVIEGEKKTLAGIQGGLNAVGIGGLWAWLIKGTPIDDLSLIEWDGRQTTIIPDSDVFERPDLMRAVYALGRELRERGAAVSVAQIPQEGASKVGLDDFLMAGGNVEDLVTFTLDQRVFQSARFWYGRWKLKKELEAA